MEANDQHLHEQADLIRFLCYYRAYYRVHTEWRDFMRFVSIRELRNQSALVWKALAQEKDLVITSNGKPIALLSAMVEENLEESLGAIRRARAQAAVTALQQVSLRAGKDRLSLEDINAEIDAARRERSR